MNRKLFDKFSIFQDMPQIEYYQNKRAYFVLSSICAILR